MIPPVDPVILQRNPNFEILYKDLCTRKLNSNGSTRDTKRQRIHDEIHKSLITARTSLLSSQILVNLLSDLPSKAVDLAPELHSIIEITTAQLQGHVPDSDRDVLSSEIDCFLDNLPAIAATLSDQLSLTATSLCQIADPSTPPPPDQLASTTATLVATSTHHLPHELHEARAELTNTATALLSTHLRLLSTAIRILEQIQHGALARHTRSSAHVAHLRSTLLALQARLQTRTHPPPAEFVAALKAYRKHVGSGERRLRDREGLARRELELYARAGDKGMRDLARRKAVLVAEVRRMEEEIGKLERGG